MPCVRLTTSAVCPRTVAICRHFAHDLSTLCPHQIASTMAIWPSTTTKSIQYSSKRHVGSYWSQWTPHGTHYGLERVSLCWLWRTCTNEPKIALTTTASKQQPYPHSKTFVMHLLASISLIRCCCWMKSPSGLFSSRAHPADKTLPPAFGGKCWSTAKSRQWQYQIEKCFVDALYLNIKIKRLHRNKLNNRLA